MKEIKLKPVYDYDKYHEHILQVLVFELYYDIFRPLFDVIGYRLGEGPVKPILEDAEVRSGARWNRVGSAVEQALKSGRITYVGGYFYGAFNALIARELRSLGASFDSRKRAYRLDLGSVPGDLKTIIIQSRIKIEKQAEDLRAKIDEIAERSLTVDLGKYVKNVFGDLDGQFVRTVKPNLEIPITMTPGMQNQLAEDYINNVNLYIDGWKKDQIVRLRQAVEVNVTEGFRADRMAKVLEAEYGVTRNKAKFIARQETGLLVSKYREQRYTEAGLSQYIWSTSHDERVRQDHKDLSGKKFSWSSPPVVDKATGRRGNPGEDFGCRCIAVPVLRVAG